jgi:hypothetical protein
MCNQQFYSGNVDGFDDDVNKALFHGHTYRTAAALASLTLLYARNRKLI